MNGNAHKIKGISSSKTSKFICTIVKNASEDMQIQENVNINLMAFQERL
jgi:hypothetical protein